MKTTGRCPKCGSKNLYITDPVLSASFQMGAFSSARLSRYICCDCGYLEEWVTGKNLERVRKCFQEEQGGI